MTSNVFPNPKIVALLSAASIADLAMPDGNHGALQRLAGQPILGYQINALQAAGVSSFLVEVDNVPGELLSLADNIRQLGSKVEFVRSVSDLRNFIKPDDRLVIQAEAHYFSTSAVSTLMQQAVPFISVIDGRDENAAFERIDLNTRWAGFAVVDARIALSMVELPDGWSITSSLLRHAIQNKVLLKPVEQAELQRGQIMRVSSQTDADIIVAQMLVDRANRSNGFIERHLFGTIAQRIAPTIWASRHGISIVAISRHVLAGASLGFAALGWLTASATAALCAIFLHNVYGVVQGFNEDKGQHIWSNIIFWALLVASLFTSAWTSPDYRSDTVAFAAIITGFALLARKTALPNWASAVLQSPALLSGAILLAAILSLFSLGLTVFALIQLAALVAALYLPEKTRRNTNHA